VNCDSKWLYNKRYYEKKKLKSDLVKKNHNIVKNIIRKYKKVWSQNYIKFHNSVAIKYIFNRLDIKNHVKKQLEAERIIRCCMHIRDSHIRNMYKILAVLKKKSQVCLSLANKCSTIDEKLRAFCGKSRHTSLSKNYFIDSIYHNVTSSQPLIMNAKGQITNGITFGGSTSKKIMDLQCLM